MAETYCKDHILTDMKKNKFVTLTVASMIAAASFLVAGCDRTVSKEEKTTVNSDGTVKTKEKTVTENSDGTVTKKEETKKTEPIKP